MSAATIEPRQDELVVDVLDVRTAGAAAAPGQGRWRPVLLPYEPEIWTEWRCPRCRQLYREPRGRCEHDQALLEDVLVSQPFLWLG